MSLEFDDFDDDIKAGDGNHGNFLCTDKQPEIKGIKTKNTTREIGLFSGISNADYHAGRGISSSNLKYADRAAEVYHAYIKGQLPFKETEAMRLGTACHKLCLEALDFSNEIVISKKFGTKAVDKEAKAEFYEQNKGMTIITADQYDTCRFMRDSFMSLSDAEYIFSTGEPELSGYYVDRETNMLAKYRPDWRSDDFIFDLKSTRDATEEAFSKTIFNLGYDISAAHYIAGDKTLKKTSHRQFIFGCVEPAPPYLAHVYVLNEESLEFGEWRRKKAMAVIKHGRLTGEYSRYKNGISTEIGIPQYAMRDFMRDKI